MFEPSTIYPGGRRAVLHILLKQKQTSSMELPPPSSNQFVELFTLAYD